MDNPYKLYMQLQNEKRADLSAIVNTANQLGHYAGPFAHGAAMFALGHVLSNSATLVKEKIPGASAALARYGARMGVHGKKLNPGITNFINNVAGPEFLLRDFNQGHALGLKARERALGEAGESMISVPQRAAQHLQKLVERVAPVASAFEPTAKTNQALTNLPKNWAKKAPIAGVAVELSKAHKLSGAIGHVASLGALAKADPLAPISAGWNQLKHTAVNSDKFRNTIKKIPYVRDVLDPAAFASRNFAAGLAKGENNPVAQTLRKLTLSPEAETFRNLGAQLRGSLTAAQREQLAAHFKTSEGYEAVNTALTALKGGEVRVQARPQPSEIPLKNDLAVAN